MLGLALPPLGCTRADLARAEACDPRNIEELVASIEAAEPEQRFELVARGLPKACKLPDYAFKYLASHRRDGASVDWTDADTQQATLALEHACSSPGQMFREERLSAFLVPPDMRPVFDRCQFDRFEVIPRQAYVKLADTNPLPWAVHQWLLDEGVPSEQARQVTVGLFSLDYWRNSFAPLVPAPQRELVAHSLPWAPIVSGDQSWLRLGSEGIAQIHDCEVDAQEVQNHIIKPLFEALELEVEKSRVIAESRGEPPPTRVLLALDEQLCFRALVDIQYTANRLEYDSFGLVIEPEPYVFSALPLRFAPQLLPATAQRQAVVVIGDGSYTIHGPSLSEPLALEGLDNLREVARSRCAELVQPVAIRAPESVQIGEIIDVVIALRGPGCHFDGSGECCLPEVIIDGGLR